MSDTKPLLMLPGPIEVSPAVREAYSVAPPGHLAPQVIEAYGRSLQRMREIWRAEPSSQPFVIPGAGTTAMEMAVANVVEPGDAAIVVNTGFFSARISEMLRRHGAVVHEIIAAPGDAPSLGDVRAAFDTSERPVRALVGTHVDTSTAVRIDPEPLSRLAREHDALAVFDGVCATAAERFEMAQWGADVYLTASQKAIGLPPGLALMVASDRALKRRAARRATPPPLSLDWESWRPVMQAYEQRKPSYFSTPPTNLILALDVALGEISQRGLEQSLRLHSDVARALRHAWTALDLEAVPHRDEIAASTVSALYYPHGVDSGLVGRVASRGVIVAGGLHPAIRDRCFRVGHMGYVVTRVDLLCHTVESIGLALRDAGRTVDVEAAVRAVRDTLQAASAG